MRLLFLMCLICLYDMHLLLLLYVCCFIVLYKHLAFYTLLYTFAVNVYLQGTIVKESFTLNGPSLNR